MLNRNEMLQYLRRHRPAVAPSMLKCDFGNLHSELQQLDAAGYPLVHLDVMDGHFVPNLSYGAMVIAAMRPLTATPFDVHLMISDPQQYVEEYVRAGCEAITFHLEAVPEPVELLTEIRRQNVVAGLAINPDTPLEAAEPFLDACDLLLVMSVHPGFGGQKFIPDVLEKVERARALRGDELLISIDGGVSTATIGRCAAAGAEIFVAGSAVFAESDYRVAAQDLTAAASVAATQA